jgi:hypothetical protein
MSFVVTALISVVALIFSVRGFNIASRSLEISKNEYLSGRTAIYDGNIVDKNDVIRINSTNKDILIQDAIVFFPPQTNIGEMSLTPPEYGIPLISLKYKLEEAIISTIKKEKGFSKLAPDSRFPIIIKSRYVAKGESFSEKSLYTVRYRWTLGDNQDDRPDIEFTGLIFEQRLPFNEDEIKLLKELWGDTLARLKASDS